MEMKMAFVDHMVLFLRLTKQTSVFSVHIFSNQCVNWMAMAATQRKCGGNFTTALLK